MSGAVKNMDCQDIRAMLSALVDDRVDTATRHNAERHLAGCSTCRSLLDEAEALDDLIVRDASGVGGASALPPGFAATVLERASIVRPTLKRSFITWAGWTAAAASLILAVLIWSFDRRMWIQDDPAMASGPRPLNSLADGGRANDGLVQRAGYERLSWTYDGDLTALSDNNTNSDGENELSTTLDRVQPASIDPSFAARDGGAAVGAGDVARAAAALADDDSRLTIDDAQTLYSVALVMETLESADLSNFAEVERIRQIAEYDNLLPRLEGLKQRLSQKDRPVVVAAECILLRIVRGPVSQQDARELLNDATGLRLARMLHAISTRHSAGTSL